MVLNSEPLSHGGSAVQTRTIKPLSQKLSQMQGGWDNTASLVYYEYIHYVVKKDAKLLSDKHI